jgi:hypothetical protein
MLKLVSEVTKFFFLLLDKLKFLFIMLLFNYVFFLLKFATGLIKLPWSTCLSWLLKVTKLFFIMFLFNYAFSLPVAIVLINLPWSTCLSWLLKVTKIKCGNKFVKRLCYNLMIFRVVEYLYMNLIELLCSTSLSCVLNMPKLCTSFPDELDKMKCC